MSRLCSFWLIERPSFALHEHERSQSKWLRDYIPTEVEQLHSFRLELEHPIGVARRPIRKQQTPRTQPPSAPQRHIALNTGGSAENEARILASILDRNSDTWVVLDLLYLQQGRICAKSEHERLRIIHDGLHEAGAASPLCPVRDEKTALGSPKRRARDGERVIECQEAGMLLPAPIGGSTISSTDNAH